MLTPRDLGKRRICETVTIDMTCIYPHPHRGDYPETLLELQLKLQRSHLSHERFQEDLVPVTLEVPPLRYMCHVFERAP